MDKRYQVFVSSTFADLKDERQAIMQTLMEMDCIPAGMELFPAADEEQMNFIRKIIDDCDYYLLLIGGRYGSTTPDGISYTELEYEYAVQKGIKVIALLHHDPKEISVSKSDTDPTLQSKLNVFRDKVANGRLVRFWKTVEELPGMVALSLSKTIKTYPAVGWVRGNTIANEDALTQVNMLRSENEQLQKRIRQQQQQQPIAPKFIDLAGLDEQLTVRGRRAISGTYSDWSTILTWREIFFYISPYLIQHPSADTVKSDLLNSIVKDRNITGVSRTLDDQIFQTISIQLRVLGLVTVDRLKTTSGTMGIFWGITPAGNQLMLELRTIRTSKTSKEAKSAE